MKRTHVLTVVALGALLLGGVAYAWMGPAYLTEEERGEWADTQEQIRQAVQSGDYESWKALMTERFNNMTTQENFDRIQEMHQEREEIRNQMQQALEDGEYGLAQELRAQIRQGKMGTHSGNCRMQE